MRSAWMYSMDDLTGWVCFPALICRVGAVWRGQTMAIDGRKLKPVGGIARWIG